MVDALEACLAELRAKPTGSVSTDAVDLAAHSIDCWPVLLKRKQQGQHLPTAAAVVRPTSLAEVVELVRIANRFGVSITPWGAGSSVVGQPIPQAGGLSVDLGALSQVIEVDEHNLQARIEAGALGSDVETHLNSMGYTLNFSPQSLGRSTVGGWVATRATGQFSSRWGGIEDALVACTLVLPTGEVVRTHPAPRAATGPDVKQYFIGAEGTLGIVAEVVLKIYPIAETRLLETVRFTDVAGALEAMRQIMRSGLRPFLLRAYDQEEARHALRDAQFTGAALMVGSEGPQNVAEAELAAALRLSEVAGGAAIGPAGAEGWMSRRYDFSAVEAVLNRSEGIAETIEVANTWSGISETYTRLKQALAPFATEVLGHFSHAYTNGTSLYVILLGEADDAASAEKRLLDIWKTTMDICVETGAAISHHHGAGLARLPWMRESLGNNLDVLDAFKQAIDPNGIFSPGRLGLSTRTNNNG